MSDKTQDNYLNIENKWGDFGNCKLWFFTYL